MAPVTLTSLSPAELSYIHTSLSQTPPIRPDGRTPTQFRPLVAETDILPSTNGSARICFADGTEAVVGVKAEVEKSSRVHYGDDGRDELDTGGDGGQEIEMGSVEATNGDANGKGQDSWLEVAIDIPGYRDDDALPVFLGAMLTEALLADARLKDRLHINSRFHWRLYVDVLLLSAPLSYPLPLLSLTTHLALLRTRLPALISEKDEDPLFNDDWDASILLYPQTTTTTTSSTTSAPAKPPITLLVMSVGANIIFDPSRDELAVADAVLALSVGQTATSVSSSTDNGLKILAIRTIDPPSRLTNAGTPIPEAAAAAAGAASTATSAPSQSTLAVKERSAEESASVWRAPRGGVGREVVSRIIKMVVEKGGVGQEVLEALEGVEG